MSDEHNDPNPEEKPSSDLLRIEYEDPRLEYLDQLVLFNGKPFTGVLQEHSEQGVLLYEFTHLDGLPEGLCREWYPDGQILFKSFAIRGKGSSHYWYWYQNGFVKKRQLPRSSPNDPTRRIWEWYETGKIKSYREIFDLSTIILKEWSEDGRLITDRKPSSVLKYLRSFFKIKL